MAGFDEFMNWSALQQMLQNQAAAGQQAMRTGYAGFNPVFAGQMQGAMGQIGGLLQANANRVSANRDMMAQYQLAKQQMDQQADIARQQIASKNRLYDAILGIFNNPAAQQPGMFNRFTLSAPGGAPTSVSATMPNGQTPGTVNTGIQDTSGSIWSPAVAGATRQFLGNQPAVPQLAGAPAGLGQQYGDALRGFSGRNFTATSRMGAENAASQRLASQAGNAQAADQLRQMLARVYSSGLGAQSARRNSAVNMLRQIS